MSHRYHWAMLFLAAVAALAALISAATDALPYL